MADKDAVLKNVKQRYNIVGNCDALNRAIDLAVKVARVDLSVLVLGENGSGKEIMPRIIHDASNRKGKKYLALNCGAIPEGTIDSELFGHVEGAFTGSVGKREGYFAAADGGTLFLDEVGELPLQTQVRLLRVLETGEYIPVGANEPRKTNVRIVAATNVDMHRAIKEGRFREDLFYRLSAVTINIPPLRERGNDIDMLFRMFALENQRKYQFPPIRLNDEARDMLMHYPWPGNVRQLKNVVDSMSILCEEREVTRQTLELFIPANAEHTQIAPYGTNHIALGEDISTDQMQSMLLLITGLSDRIKKLEDEVRMLKGEHADKATGKNGDDRQRQLYISSDASQKYAPRPIDNEDVYEEIIDDDVINSINSGVSFAAHRNFREVADDAEFETAETADDEKPRTMQEHEEDLIRQSLKRNDGNRRKTAKELELSERTLYRKIKEYGIEGKREDKQNAAKD